MTRRRAAAALASAAALVLGLGVPTATTAAWTDQVLAQADASAGTWAPPPSSTRPVGGGEDTTRLSDADWGLPDAIVQNNLCVAVKVASTSSTPAPWSIRLYLDEAPLWGEIPTHFWSPGAASPTASAVQVDAGGARFIALRFPSPALLSVDSPPTRVSFCAGGRLGTPPVADPSWFTVAQKPTGTWTAQEACVALTATGRVDPIAHPFFFGWAGTLDLSGAIAEMRRLGGHPGFVSFRNVDTSQFTATPALTAASPVTTITSGHDTALVGSMSVTITACVS